MRAQRERMVGSSCSSSSAHRMSVVAGGGSSSVLSSADCATSFIRWASRMIATRCAAFDREQREVDRQPPDRPGLRVLVLTDPDLHPGPGRRELVEVGVVPVLHHPASPARAAGPVAPGRARAQQGRGEIEGQRVLANGWRPDQEQGVGNPRDEHGVDGRRGGRLADGEEAVHERASLREGLSPRRACPKPPSWSSDASARP